MDSFRTAHSFCALWSCTAVRPNLLRPAGSLPEPSLHVPWHVNIAVQLHLSFTLRPAPAERRLGEMSLDLGLARFGAITHLDLLAACSAHASMCLRQPGSSTAMAYPLFVLTPASVGHLTCLASSLTFLRLVFDERAEVFSAPPCSRASLRTGPLMTCPLQIRLAMLARGSKTKDSAPACSACDCVCMQPWTLEGFSPFTRLRELDVTLWRRCPIRSEEASKLRLAASLTGVQLACSHVEGHGRA